MKKLMLSVLLFLLGASNARAYSFSSLKAWAHKQAVWANEKKSYPLNIVGKSLSAVTSRIREGLKSQNAKIIVPLVCIALVLPVLAKIASTMDSEKDDTNNDDGID